MERIIGCPSNPECVFADTFCKADFTSNDTTDEYALMHAGQRKTAEDDINSCTSVPTDSECQGSLRSFSLATKIIGGNDAIDSRVQAALTAKYPPKS